MRAVLMEGALDPALDPSPGVEDGDGEEPALPSVEGHAPLAASSATVMGQLSEPPASGITRPRLSEIEPLLHKYKHSAFSMSHVGSTQAPEDGFHA